jgi:bifunctional hydroxylase/dehydrase
MVGGQDVVYAMPGTPSHPLLGRRLEELPALKSAGGSDVGQPDDIARCLREGRGFVLSFAGTTGARTAAADHDLAGWADRVEFVSAQPEPAVHADALLVRPDSRIAWVGQLGSSEAKGGGTAGLTAQLRRWFGEPTARAEERHVMSVPASAPASASASASAS